MAAEMFESCSTTYNPNAKCFSVAVHRCGGPRRAAGVCSSTATVAACAAGAGAAGAPASTAAGSSPTSAAPVGGNQPLKVRELKEYPEFN